MLLRKNHSETVRVFVDQRFLDLVGQRLGFSGHRSKSIDEFAGRSFDYVLTVCDNAKESCPIFPGHANRLHRNFDDPTVAQGSEEERLEMFRRVRDEIRDYLKRFPHQ
jgi:arsenate reductase